MHLCYTMIFAIVLLIIIILLICAICKKMNDENKIQKPKKSKYVADIILDDTNIFNVSKKDNTKEPPRRFVEAHFHIDYMDVADAFKKMGAERQIFNINNVPAKVTYGVDVSIVEYIVTDFINELNDQIDKISPMVDIASSSWNETNMEYNDNSQQLIQKHPFVDLK